MSATKIEWTDVTWNPTRGCSRVSEGCRNCYAERIAARFSGPREAYEGFAAVREGGRHGQSGRTRTGIRGHWTGKVALIPEKLEEPLHWRKPRRVFVNSMSDLFHEGLPDVAVVKIFTVMEACPQHTFQILTKRPERMQRLLSHPHFQAYMRKLGYDWLGPKSYQERGPHWRSNVWLGVSVENQATADERIPLLLQTPAAVRFVSYEPALGPVDFTKIGKWRREDLSALQEQVGYVERPRLDWIIVGGESGPGARRFDVDWARSIIRQCRDAGVACFVKQLGSNPTTNHRTRPAAEPAYWTSILHNSKGGDPAEWPEDLRVREFPA